MSVSIAFRTLTQVNFSLDFDETQTIAEVKAKIAEEKGENYAVDLQKLIYNGKVLTDTNTVADIGFDSSKFVVVMLAKKKAPEAAPSTSAAPEKVVAVPEKVEAAPIAALVAAVDSDALTAEQEAAVASLMEIGSDRDKAIAVLRAAFWNADRAVDYLFNGIPDNVVGEERPARGRRAGQFGTSVQDHMDAVANMPQLDQIRAILRENPEMLEEVLDEIAAVDPAIVQTIQANQQAFMDILNGTGDAGRQRGNSLERRRNEVQANQEEAEAIRRIKAIVVNAPEALVVEAYYACDKNEDLAIEFIYNVLAEQYTD